VAAIFALGEHLGTHLAAVAAAMSLGTKLGAVATATLGLSPNLGAVATTVGAFSTATLNLGVVTAAMSTTVPTLVSERRCRNRQCRSTGREHPNAHGNSPFNV